MSFRVQQIFGGETAVFGCCTLGSWGKNGRFWALYVEKLGGKTAVFWTRKHTEGHG
ncbi:MAG: hypothetical protein H6668_04410 [Ardenticatenaceae bacterium]|nr:hypothetical protein [Ardenticatenaceae bacterium]